MPEEARFPAAKRFRRGSGPPSRVGSCPPGRRVVMLLTAGSGGRGGGGRGGGEGGGRRQPPLAQPSASPYREALELQRRSLPIFQARGQLLAQLRNLDSAVLIGETGSGKTTQLPQYLYEVGIGRQGIIAVTQPRRVAAISLATRVSDEKRTELGKLVGYTVRFEDVTSEDTRIKFLTDGMLLREAISDSLLRKYSCVILDEAHERTIHTDVLFGVVKAAQKRRKELGKLPLKVVVMSATMDVDLFSQYFNGAPVLYLEGRQHPIQIFYTKQPQHDYLHAALVSVFQIHQEAPSSQDILVFLTGQEEIEAMSKTCRDIAKHLPDGCPGMLVLPLYASLPYTQQLRVFQGAPKGYRKVIISTNIAETSITISGIKYVVDTGMVKAKKYNPDSGLEVLAVQRVSKTQAWQRTGRAGREDSGVCYRLYTEEEFEKFDKMTVPEIQRCNLSNVMLQLLAMKVPNVLTFDFMSKPSPDHIQAAIAQLDLLGALEHKDDQLTLTPIGRKMAAFPLEPKFAKTILLSPKFHCTEEILTIVSLLSVDSVLYSPPARRDEVQGVRKKFISSEGDHITLLNIYRAFKNIGGNKDWCKENFVNSKNMMLVAEVRAQLREICLKMSMPILSSRGDVDSIRRCLAHSLFMSTAELQPDGTYATTDTHQPVAIHPSSVLFHCKPACVVYTELLYTNKCYMRDLCVVDAEWLYEAAPEYFRRKLRTARS
ncbi:ATP-dependent RNA helicase DHX33 isoform X1 [Fukomys damarensis]|uniref:ATP-dependent RNA helicase DHX33 n=2 Tax=Fukomys damarensis TaxID=885580 RepID=A0A091CWC4_FUKDA|nr:ATP-dependent RNA helicase DHX33 isoform X1 [Fukomys damarensis]KFO22937.1 Putative ATP-dependent RNA helicase DHX33 [Fukomys damarensis]